MDPPPRYRAENYKPSGKLDDTVALITGGDSGIGRAVALMFAREGADVAITYLEEEESDAQVVKQEIEDQTQRTCLLLPGDIGDSSVCNELVEKTVSELGKLDVLVNNAATMPPGQYMDEMTDDEIERVYRANVFSYYYMTRAALSHLSEGSSIINTGSIVGSRGGPHMSIYAPTKGAIHAMTKCWAKEFLDRGIRVNCVAPGPVWTPLQACYQTKDSIVHYAEKNPAGRPGQPEELAPSYVFFASNADSSYITGEIMFVTGGDVAR
jgi:NAD(P)-dependent dehydrogenase (short-subunit alcohol dehydrogenase family)